MDALIGYSGFVGGNLGRQHRFDGLFNSKNIADVRGQSFRRIVHAGTPARKWWANAHPDEDWRSIEAALGPLREASAEQLILISTIDVLPLIPGVDEGFNAEGHQNHVYGRHRLRLERELVAQFARVTIVRLPALFGPGLKKNVIYDLAHDNLLEKVNPGSQFQYYDLTRLWADIDRAVGAGLELVHLVTEPIATREIVQRLFPGKSIGADPAARADYDFRTRHAGIFGGRNGYLAGREETLNALARFIAAGQFGIGEGAT